MASHRLLNHHSVANKVHNFRIHGRSTSQVSLRKILNTICSFPPPRDLLNDKSPSHACNNVPEEEHKRKKPDCKSNIRFDLNLPLGSPPPQLSESNNSAIYCDLTEPENSRREDCPETETETATGDADKWEIRTREITPPSGNLELLIEAVELLSTDSEEEIEKDPKTKRISKLEESRKRKDSMRRQNHSSSTHVGKKRRRSNRLKESEDTTATAAAATEKRKVSSELGVTRSRSGRCQVIPLKYRDSDFEPATAVNTTRR